MIEVRQLTKRYRAKCAVDDLSFEVQPGRVTAFVGPNGAGKSTTMRILLGLDAADHGRALVNGRRYQSLARPLHEVGTLLDANAVHPGRRALNHLLCVARAGGIPRRRVVEVIELAGLVDVANRRVGGFSLGMKQRLGIALALLGDPPVLILDEPVNGLDMDGMQWIRGLLRSFATEGRTVLVSSHLMSEIEQTADHLVVIGRGRLLADVGVAELLDMGAGHDVFVRSPQLDELSRLLSTRGASVNIQGDRATVRGLDADEIARLAAAHRVPLYELTRSRPSLEAVYVQLTETAVEHHAFASNGSAA